MFHTSIGYGKRGEGLTKVLAKKWGGGAGRINQNLSSCLINHLKSEPKVYIS